MNQTLNQTLPLYFCEGYAVSRYQEKVILMNTTSGLNFKMTEDCFNVLSEMIRQNVTVETGLSWFQDPDDQDFFRRALEVMIKYGILVQEPEQEVYTVTLELTNRCNLRCRHCCMNALPACEDTDLPTEDWKRIIDKLSGLHLEALTLTGGEPLIRQDFFEIAQYAKDTLKVPMQLMSNATLITEAVADRLIELFDDFSFSLDGADEESCAPVRGKGVFANAMRGIMRMKERGMKHFSLSFTEVRQNQHAVQKFEDLCKELGATPMIRNFDLVGRAATHLDLVPEDVDADYMPVTVPFPKGCDCFPPHDMPVGVSCGAILEKFAIGYDGTLFPCISMIQPEFGMGNVLDIDDFASFYRSGGYQSSAGYQLFRNSHPAFSPECADCPARLFCDNCVTYIYRQKNHPKRDFFCALKQKELLRVW
ncbi:MAG: radical SAM protein [Oscillospiraceae bacterium]|nr:radical SAM protein [Oscillospiraceae bacterium]MBP0989222.1 radical SAM protein [Oscillospiraceae bacterium]MBQ5337918.1 radical SAM protein [Oscillospiraceae bacterium]